jgi:hypothetical protein
VAALLALLACAAAACAAAAAPPPPPPLWTEELALEALPPRHVLARLEFSAAAPAGARHAGAFPPAALDALAAAPSLAALELTLGAGRWPAGVRLPGWAAPPPPGLEARAEFAAGAGAPSAALAAAAPALAALLAVAPEALGAHAAVAEPAAAWVAGRPARVGGARAAFAAAPREALCGENLAALLRLLPCRGAAGLAALLRPGHLLAAPVHALTLALSTGNSSSGALEARLTLGVTLLIEARGTWPAGGGAAAALAAAFGAAPAPPACPAAARAGVYLRGGGAAAGCAPASAAGWAACAADGGATPPASPACSGAAAEAGWALRAASRLVPASPTTSLLRVQARVEHGAGGSRAEPALLHVLQILPWELTPLWRSLRLSLDGARVSLAAPPAGALAWHAVRPAAPRGRAGHFEALLRLPAGANASAALLELQLDRRPLLAVADYHPDASRGADLPPALLALAPPGAGGGGFDSGAASAAAPLLARLACGGAAPRFARGAPAAAPLPIPDASMPFNVASFSSTAVALFLGVALRALLASPAEVVEAAADGGESGARPLVKRLRRAAVAAAVGGGLAVYLDRELQRRAAGWLAAAGLPPLLGGGEL